MLWRSGWSARFLKLMWSHGLVLKSTIYPEWSGLAGLEYLCCKNSPPPAPTDAPMYPDWFGFVPIKVDYSDLASVMAL